MTNTIGNLNRGSELEHWSGFDMVKTLEKDAEIESLRQQIEILKQELNCQCELTQIYRQELKDTESELKQVQIELSNRINLNQQKS